jgi:hypothetical protein
MPRLLSFIISTVLTLTLVLTSCSPTEEPLEPNQYRVTYDFYITRNNSVGNDWYEDLLYKGDFVRSGSVLTLPKSFSFRCKITEHDASPDVGSKTVSFSNLEIGEKQEKTVYITVREDKGRYAGNTATWEATVTVERLS